LAFAYASLLGVYFAGLFKNRGSEKRVLYALIGGFITVFLLQKYIIGVNIDFSIQMVVGTLVSFLVMVI